MRRTLSPAATPIGWRELAHGLVGALSPSWAIAARGRELREHFGATQVALVASGTAALTLALLALKRLSTRTEVVIPAYTCFSVPAAVLKAGLKPVLCDISPGRFDFDPVALERIVGDRTLCVVAQHLFGVPSPLAKIRFLCLKHGAYLIEDAAQAMGGTLHGQLLGTIGDLGVFSLGRGKNVTCGSGGVVITRSIGVGRALREADDVLGSSSPANALKDAVRMLCLLVFGHPRLFWLAASLPFLRLGQTIFPKHIPMKRLSGFNAGCLHRWQERLQLANRSRLARARLMAERIAVRLPDDRAAYLRLPLTVRVGTKSTVCALAARSGLGISGAYPTAINEIPEVRAVSAGERFPNAEHAAASMVTLPTHHWVSGADRDALARCVEPFVFRTPRVGDRRRAS